MRTVWPRILDFASPAPVSRGARSAPLVGTPLPVRIVLRVVPGHRLVGFRPAGQGLGLLLAELLPLLLDRRLLPEDQPPQIATRAQDHEDRPREDELTGAGHAPDP